MRILSRSFRGIESLEDLETAARAYLPQRVFDSVASGTERHASLTDNRAAFAEDRKSTRLNSSHANISYAVFCLKKKTHQDRSLFIIIIHLILTTQLSIFIRPYSLLTTPPSVHIFPLLFQIIHSIFL